MCETIQQEIDAVQKHKSEIEASKNFTYIMTQSKNVDVKLPPGINMTNCLVCNNTCHDNCPYANDEDKCHCCTMDFTGYCCKCTGKCHWSQHHNSPFKLVVSQELKQKYEAAKISRRCNWRYGRTPMKCDWGRAN